VEHKSSWLQLVCTEYCEILFQTWQILAHLCLQWAQIMGFSRTLHEAFSLMITPFWDVILYTLVHRCQCLCLLLFNPEVEDIRFLQNTAIYMWHSTVSHNISVSFELICFHSGADEDSTFLEFMLCRMVNSCWCLKECNASIFRVKQSKKIYSLFHDSIIFVLYIYEMVYNIGTSNAYCKCIYSVLQDACETLLKRLEPFKNAKPKGKWADWVKDAYEKRVSLSATGFYRWGELFTLRFKCAFKFRYCLEFFRSI
jgi:hypothetical protein